MLYEHLGCVPALFAQGHVRISRVGKVEGARSNLGPPLFLWPTKSKNIPGNTPKSMRKWLFFSVFFPHDGWACLLHSSKCVELGTK